MEIARTFNKNQGFVKVILTGKYVFNKFKTFYSKLIGEMAELGINSILWDARQLDVGEVSQEQIRKIIAYIGKKSASRQGGKAAWIAQDELGYGMGRMFESISDYNIDIQIQVFRNIQEAELWIVGQES